MRNLTYVLAIVTGLCLGQEKPAEKQPEEAAPEPELDAGFEAPGATLELGARAVSVKGEKTFGFQQYRDIPKGAFIRRFDYRLGADDNPRRFTFQSVDLLQRDMLFKSKIESAGRFRLQVDWLGISRFWGNHGRSVLAEVHRGIFAVPAGLRASLENAPNTLLPGLARDAVAASPQVEIRSFRERLTVIQTFHLSPWADLKINFMQERRSGNRIMAFGTFNRTGTADGDTFETPGQELWEPTAFGTTEFGAELSFAKANWVAGVEYRGSLFNNHTAALIYQNPFRLTAAQATPASTNPQPPTGGATGGGSFRGRFAELQSSLPPDNQAHTLTGHAAIFFPRSSKVSGLFSWSRWTQNQAFLPYTDNPAVTVNPGQAGPSAPLTSVAALPQSSLNGLVHTLSGDFVATTRPFHPLQLTFRYNDYDLSDDTRPILFPGSVAVLNSFWSQFHTGTPGRLNVPIESKEFSYRRRRALFELALKPVKNLTWKGAYQYGHWDRTNREADTSNEHGALTSISYSPLKAVFAEGSFGYSNRRPKPYSDQGGLENVLIRMYDQSNKVAKHGNALFSVSPHRLVILSGSWFYSEDRFDKGFLGLHQMKTNSISVDASFNLESFGFYAGWGYDRTGYDMVGATGATLPPALRFSRDTRDSIHSAHTGFSGSYAKGKGTYQFNYAMGLSRVAVSTANVDLVPVTSTLNSQAFPFPTVKSQFHEFRLDTSYQIAKNLRLGFFYLLEPYRLNDFANDSVSPYGGDAVAPQQNDASRYYFLDAGPTNYLGNAVAVYLRYSFR